MHGGTLRLLPPLSSFLFILKKDVMSQLIKIEKWVFNFTVKYAHVDLSLWNPIQKCSDIQLSGTMLPKSANLQNSEQDTSYVAMQ